MSDLLETLAFLGRVLLRVLLFVARVAEVLSVLADLGALIARGWRRLRGRPGPARGGDRTGQGPPPGCPPAAPHDPPSA